MKELMYSGLDNFSCVLWCL